MGRKRTSGCQLSHTSGQRCKPCERRRARAARLRTSKARQAENHEQERRKKANLPPLLTMEERRKAARSPERIFLDDAAEKRQNAIRNARRSVAIALKRGTIVPATACERCGDRNPSAWHPDPAKPQEIAWLCRSCKAYAQHSGEDIELSWVWPGHSIPIRDGRPRCVSPEGLPEHIHEAEQTAAPVRARLGPAGDVLFFSHLRRRLGPEIAEELLRQGLRAIQRGNTWTPFQNPDIDRLLAQWITYERSRSHPEVTRWVAPPAVYERRPRRDRELLLPPQTAPIHVEEYDPEQLAQEREAAFAKLDTALSAANAIFAKYGI